MGLRLPPRIRMNPRLEEPLMAKPRPSLASVSNYGTSHSERTVHSLFQAKPQLVSPPELHSCELCATKVRLGSPSGRLQEAIVSETSLRCADCTRYVCQDCRRDCEKCGSISCHLCSRVTYQLSATFTFCEKCYR